ncbi:MAG: serine hydrolase domain-containing protein [Candidatus Heimdallarchaeaceae archaeon]
MKKKQLGKMVLFSFILTALLLSPVLPLKVVAVAPTDIFDAEFDTQVEVLMNTAKVESLALSVVNGTEEFYATGYGEQPGTDIVYYLGGVSGCIATTALLQLMDDGLFDINDPVNDYLPWILRNPYYPSTPLTIHDILSQRTGIKISDEILEVQFNKLFPFPDLLYEVLNENGSYYTTDSWLNLEPGTVVKNAWIHFDVAAFLVELISDEPYEQYVTDNIFTPLGMTNTKFNYTNYTPSQLAKQYLWNSTSGVNEEQIFYDYAGLGSAGVLSTVEDLSKFLIVHMNKGVYDTVRILEESTVQLMHTTVSNNWGLGWDNIGIAGYHGFFSGPWIGAAYMLTGANIGVIVFTNQGLFEEGYAGKTDDLAEYILTTAEELISLTPTPTDENSFGFFVIPMMLASLGTAILFIKKRKK